MLDLKIERNVENQIGNMHNEFFHNYEFIVFKTKR